MRRVFQFLCQTIGFVLIPFICVAVEPYSPTRADPVLEPWRWQEMEELNGLGVVCVDEAPDGTFWFGNVGSIAHYDGMQVQKISFDEELLTEISSATAQPITHALLVARDETLLMMIENSLVSRTSAGWKVILKNIGPISFEAKLEQAEDGSFWVLTRKGLWHLSEDFQEVDRVVKKWQEDDLMAFCRDAHEDIWLVHRMTSQRLTDLVHIPLKDGKAEGEETWEIYNFNLNGPGGEVSLETGSDGLIWYVDNNVSNGIHAFDPEQGTWSRLDRPRSENSCFSLMRDRQGTLWAGGIGSLLAIRNTPSHYNSKQLMLPAVPLTIFEDSDGRWWIMGRGGQVYLVDRDARHWKSYEGLHFECESDAGVQWFLKSNRAVVSHDPSTGKWVQYGTEDGLINFPRSLTVSSHGLIWATGAHKGTAAFSVFDGKTWTRYSHPELAPIIGNNGVFEAADGTMWFGGLGNVPERQPDIGGALQCEVLKNGKIKLVKHYTRSVLPPRISCFAQTPDGVLWVGAPSIVRFDPVSGKVQPVEELPKTGTDKLLVDRTQELWALKAGYGLFQKKADGWLRHTLEDGLVSEMVVDLLPLRDGSLLAATDKGISRFDGQIWMSRTFSDDFAMSPNGGTLRQANDGSIWFNFSKSDKRSPKVMLNRGNLFSTLHYMVDIEPPDTFIDESVKDIASPVNAYFSWSGRDRWANTPVGDLQYSWRLNGAEWSPFSYKTGQTFFNVDDGRCLLEVRARDRDFNIDPTPAQLRFNVLPPIWRQGWFITMVLLFSGMIVLLIVVVVRSRENHLKERQQDRERHLIEQQEEQQARQTERERLMLEMDQLKTGFFINISHELRTPLAVILGPLQNLLAVEKDERKKHMLSMMERNAHRLSTLVTQLLDFRKIEQGKIRLEITEGEIGIYVQGLVESLQPLAENKDVRIAFTKPNSCRAWFDPDKLHKILTNLVTNAIKYTPAGGDVSILMKIEEETTAHRWVEFMVEDSGRGITAEHRLHIFERFYRIPEKALIDGSGIGLNLTKELVDLYGGEICVESPVFDDSERPGSRFTVRLPIDRDGFPQDVVIESTDCGVLFNPAVGSAEQATAVVLAPSDDAEDEMQDTDAEALDNPIVLVVEDDADIRDFIMGGLKDRYRVVGAINGAEGLEKTRELVPDLVVTDLMMPIMDGLELCRSLRGHVETSHIPVLMLTAQSSLEHQIEGLETGAADYITKPFHMVLLQTKIANILESRVLLQRRFRQQWADEPIQGAPCTSEVDSGELERPVAENHLDQEFLEKVCRILEENGCDPEFSSSQLATELNMGLRTLQRKVKAMSNCTPVNLILEFRLKKSTELLRDPSFNITETAFEVGFNDSGNFYRQFKKQYGMSPSEYRSKFGA